METPDPYEAALLVRHDNRGWFIFLYTPEQIDPDRDCQINERQLYTPRLSPTLVQEHKDPAAPRPWLKHLRFDFHCDACPVDKSATENTRVHICMCTDATPRSEIAQKYRWYSFNEVQAMLQQTTAEIGRALAAALQRFADPPIAIAS